MSHPWMFTNSEATRVFGRCCLRICSGLIPIGFLYSLSTETLGNAVSAVHASPTWPVGLLVLHKLRQGYCLPPSQHTVVVSQRKRGWWRQPQLQYQLQLIVVVKVTHTDQMSMPTLCKWQLCWIQGKYNKYTNQRATKIKRPCIYASFLPGERMHLLLILCRSYVQNICLSLLCLFFHWTLCEDQLSPVWRKKY